MAPDMAIDMRRTKLKASEAALLAGELKKPSWESRNEGIHERISFEDSIWGFDLAGGSYYKTPLRVVSVKPDSRAEKAGIRPGDKLKRINDIDTSTLTIQEAHKIIIESGIHLKLAVSAPEDEEDSYYCYEDPIEDGYDSDEERRLWEEKVKKRQYHAKVSSYWSLQWPWVSKRRIIYKESNCFLVPSTYENQHRDKFLVQPSQKMEDDIVLQSTNSEKALKDALTQKNNENMDNKHADNSTNQKKLVDGWLLLNDDSGKPLLNDNLDKKGKQKIDCAENKENETNDNKLQKIPEVEEEHIITENISDSFNVNNDDKVLLQNDEVMNLKGDEITDEIIDSQNEEELNNDRVLLQDDEVMNLKGDEIANEIIDSQNEEELNDDQVLLQDDEVMNLKGDEITDEIIDSQNEEELSAKDDDTVDSQNKEILNSTDDEIINEVLNENAERMTKEEVNILDSILSKSDNQLVDNSESADER